MVVHHKILHSTCVPSFAVAERDMIPVIFLLVDRGPVVLTDIHRDCVLLVKPFVQCSEVPITFEQGATCGHDRGNCWLVFREFHIEIRTGKTRVQFLVLFPFLRRETLKFFLVVFQPLCRHFLVEFDLPCFE